MSDSDSPKGPIVTKQSPLSVPDTVSRLVEMIRSKNMKLFGLIDQREEARLVGLELRETTLVISGSPVAGPPVMQAAPLAALELPLKILVWDDAGQTNVSYTAPSAIADRY